ncbi:hypothetical protein NW752_006689 [Fusarium irregulare]|nr:hypothetical protein NW752_006689 [Fusarium irregulare]
MNWQKWKSRSKRQDVENKAQVHLDLKSDSWPLDLDIDNIITIIRNNEAKEAEDGGEMKAREKSYRINFAVLQRIRMRQLKFKLAKEAADLRFNFTEPSEWKQTLGDYIQALKDYEYMEKRSLAADDPFYMGGEKWLDRNLLERIIGDNADKLELDDESNEFDAIGYWQKDAGDADLVSDTRKDNYRRNWFSGFYERLGMATVAGIFLIVPMWLMVLHNTLWTALVSTTVFVVVFGVLAAWFLTSSMEVMSSTAAYAAVLVVFVGLITEMNDE